MSSATYLKFFLRSATGRRGCLRIDFYAVLLALDGVFLRPLSPGARCALTAPFHPLPAEAGGLFSVALSCKSP